MAQLFKAYYVSYDKEYKVENSPVIINMDCVESFCTAYDPGTTHEPHFIVKFKGTNESYRVRVVSKYLERLMEVVE